MVAHACNSSAGGHSRTRSSTLSSATYWVQSQPGWLGNENLSQMKKQECGDPVCIPTWYPFVCFIVVLHDVQMMCMCGHVSSAHVYDHRTTLWSPFSPPTFRKVLGDQTQVIRLMWHLTYWAILPAPSLVLWHPLSIKSEQIVWLVPSFSTKYELWILAILTQCK